MLTTDQALSKLPLCVDLDGTLLKTDSLLEAVFLLVKQNPLEGFKLIWWLRRGKASFKHHLAKRLTVDPATLVYRLDFLEYLQQEAKTGRQLVLATASHDVVARSVADHLGIFSQVVASDEKVNRPGKAKAEALVALFGEKGFVYAGNSTTDLAVWAHAAGAVVVGASSSLSKRAASVTTVVKEFPAKALTIGVVLRALRSYQWAKNALIFIPLLAAHRLFFPGALGQAVLAVAAFSLAASGVYLINDLLDLTDDRRHPVKKYRPLASGEISLATGLGFLTVVWVLAALLASFLNPDFWVVLIVYVVASLAYSLYLKRVVLVDVVLLALLYVIRIFAGATAIGVAVSSWLLTFALFMFLSLALVKRFAELRRLKQADESTTAGRGYHVEDLPLLGQLGTASGLVSILVLTFYISSSEVLRLYDQPQVLWFIIPLMVYWISRIWLFTNRGRLQEDALMFALKDKVSFGVFVAVFLVVLWAV